MKKAITSLLTMLLLTATLFATATPGSAGEICTSDPYPTSDKAKEGFGDDCGQPFKQTTDYRCDWTPSGWECKGPGTSQSATARKHTKIPPPRRTRPASPGKQQNDRLTNDFRDDVAEQLREAEYQAARLQAEEWDRQQREARIEKERFERERRRLQHENGSRGQDEPSDDNKTAPSTVDRDCPC